jgi:hypothetical protein
MAKGSLPRKKVEYNWDAAKDFALKLLKERRDMESPRLVEALNKEFKFGYPTAPYRVINSLLDENRIHYHKISGNSRLIRYGPKKGLVAIIGPSKEAPEEPAVQVPEPIEEVLAVNEPVIEEMPEEPVADIPVPTEETMSLTIGSTSAPIKPFAEDAERIAIRSVTKKTALPILEQVDAALEKALTPELRAKLRLVSAMARESGYDVPEGDLLELRNFLRGTFRD